MSVVGGVGRPWLAAAALAGVLALGGCFGDAAPPVAPTEVSPSRTDGSDAHDSESRDSGAEAADPDAGAPGEVDPAAATGWGPTEGELAEAKALVADWNAEQLAGQVIVGRFHGYDPVEAAALVSDLHLAGLSVTNGNIADEAQVRALTEAIGAAGMADGRDFPAVVGVDQEGGYVSHLGSVATEFPAFAAAGAAIAADGEVGRKVTRAAARTTGWELRDLGFTWVFAPVADVTIGAADPTIGTRSPSTDPDIAGRAVAAAVRGYNEVGVVSTTKHFPGHGSATSDSHDTLPVLEATRSQLAAVELPPFATAIDQSAPAVMMSHLDVTAVDPGVPASLAPGVYRLLREDLGFEGVAITDSLGMGAVAGLPKPAVQALNAGADLLLMPVDTVVTHGVVTEAITTGEVPRERVEEAAARVVALQMWQQRIAAQSPVPVDFAEQAATAAAELSAAAY